MIIYTKIISVERLINDLNGNPRWKVQTETDTLRTQPGSQCAYGFDKWVGRTVVLHTTPSGLIYNIEENLDPEPFWEGM